MYYNNRMADKPITQKNMIDNKELPGNSRNNNGNIPDVTKPTSLYTLIIWNISKALANNPTLDIKDAIKAAQARLEEERGVSAMTDSFEQRHLACSILAWQQLGHSDTDSLCEFIESKLNDHKCFTALSMVSSPVEASTRNCQYLINSKGIQSMSYGSIGPVVKLPVESKIVMRMECPRSMPKKPQEPLKGTMDKIEAACCLDSVCASRLAKLDADTKELRRRAGTLAKREAQRVELLERAEAAWRDLELGYQRRLRLAEEKEEDLSKQIQKSMDERIEYRNACTTLASQLKEKGDKAEKERAALRVADMKVCELGCLGLKLSEESARCEAVLTDYQCKTGKLERDLQIKEQKARRTLMTFKSELESSQTITLETERALRAELSSLRDQIVQVSNQLLGQDAETGLIKNELEDLRQEKMEIAGNLEGCQLMCDGQIQDKIDELKKKREQLLELKDRVIECQCKLPVDVAVEVKRTVSLVALCRCTSEDKLMESCSCTSLRGTLLSNLLGDLFSGLQTELGGTGTQMPCQLLKCLEDQHNWDRASIVKSNLKDYFGQLLIGELDIAVGTSIEKYHAKWVGLSCADTARMKQDPGEDESDGWQKRAIERRAQKLATKLAEQLFQDRANELKQRAKDGDLTGLPPCKCKLPEKGCKDTAVYSMLVQPTTLAHVDGRTTPANTPTYWQQTMQGVTQLRVQIEDLKKDSIKKEDLKVMEEKITNCFQRGSGIGKTDIQGEDLFIPNAANDKIDKKEQKINRAVNLSNYYVNPNKPVNPKKKQIESNSLNKKGQKSNMNHFNGSDKTFKSMKKHGQTYAINMCMCSQRDPNKIALQNKSPNHSVIEEGKGGYRKDRASKDSILKSNSVKQTKPINSSLKSQDISTRSLSPKQQSCKSNCICFHKVPSNTSIDKLLETLTKWKSGLNLFKTEQESENEIRCCDFIPGGEINELNNRKQMQNDLSMPICCTKDTTIAKQKSILSSSLGTIKNVNKASNAVEQTVNNDLISGKASNFVEERGQISSFQTCYCDKPSSINTKINAKTPSEMDKEKKSKDINNNKNATANVDASLKSRASNVEKEKSNLSKGVFCDSKSNPTNMNTVSIAPEITESEYMGAINLDKSNEDFCRCVNSMLECGSKSLTTKIEKIIQGNKSDIMSLGEPQQQKKSQTKANDSHKNSSSAMLKPMQSKSDDIQKNEKELFPCDCGYDIQFLGVTVTDMSFENAEKEEKMEASNIGGKNETNYKENIGENETNKNKDIFLNINNAVCEEFSTKLKQQASISDTIIEPNIIDEVKIVNKDKKTMDCHNKSCKRMASSENKQNFNGFKNEIGDVFQDQPTNNDKGHDVQSFKDNKSEEESCVCCDKQKGDDSKDLEENTFHLLEQHLKKKLEKFKNLASCNSTCIPPEEEEKLFSTILKRVKKIIRDSTNQITCKCSNEEDNSGGSWKRAYGLLQEYLKTKIKRVQCSCVLAEDNKDTILPEVLEKVCNLIEHDFQRLKDVCTCKTSKLQVNKDSRPVYFKDEVPERDTDFFNIQNNAVHTTMNSCCSQNPQTSAIFKENISTQVAATLGMETKSCNPLETHTMNVQTLGKTQESFKTFELSQGCNYFDKKPDAELLCTNGIENMKSEESSSKTFSHKPYIGYALECMCKNNECTNNTIPVIYNDNTALVNDVQKLITGKNDSENRTYVRNDDAELLGANETKTNQLSDPVKNDCIYKPINSSLSCPMNENAKKGDYNSENIAHFQNKPYIGITIDCSCDTAVGACVCPKSVLQVDTGVMDSIMKKSMPNDEFYEKVSYILKSNPTETAHNYQTYLMPEMTGDLYLHNVLEEKTLCLDDSKQDCGIDTSLCDGEEMVIKKSREHFETAHTTTNTFDDNTSFENNELPLDWCECCSHMLSRDLNRDQLKKSVYFPDNDIKTDNKVSVSKYCDCDMVPMCHVKMLVKNIENKLVSAKCTCDSMTPEVCPIHCTKC